MDFTGLPFFGHLKLMYKKPAGFAKSWLNLKEIRSQYCTEQDKLLRLNLPPLNPINGKVVILFDPNDVEQVYRHEGKYPFR